MVNKKTKIRKQLCNSRKQSNLDKSQNITKILKGAKVKHQILIPAENITQKDQLTTISEKETSFQHQDKLSSFGRDNACTQHRVDSTR